jgi:hypothetical protein
MKMNVWKPIQRYVPYHPNNVSIPLGVMNVNVRMDIMIPISTIRPSRVLILMNVVPLPGFVGIIPIVPTRSVVIIVNAYEVRSEYGLEEIQVLLNTNFGPCKLTAQI